MLKIRIFDDDKVIAQQESENIDGFKNLWKDIKIKYKGQNGRNS